MSLALEIAALHGISSGTYHPYNVVTGKPYQGKNIAIKKITQHRTHSNIKRHNHRNVFNKLQRPETFTTQNIS